MSVEFTLGGIIIRVKINGYLKNEIENENFRIDSRGIKTKNKITYQEDDIKSTINIGKNEVILVRENDEFKNVLIFSENETTITEYLLKENGFVVELHIKTISLIVNDNIIEIVYQVIETDNIYEYKIEMSECL